MIAAALMALQTLNAVPGFEAAPPAVEERVALPHIADAMRAETPAQRKASLDAALALLPRPTRFRGAFQCMRGSLLMTEDRVVNRAVASAAIEECYRLNPDLPVAQRMRADLAFGANDVRTGAALLAQAVRSDPRMAHGLTIEGLETIFRQLGYARAVAERRALVVALAGTDAARDDAAAYSGWVREAVLDRVEANDLAGAGTLLPYIVDPSDGLAMIVDRRYAPLWPRIDEWAGGTLELQRDALERAERAAFAVTPTLRRARSLAMVLARTGHVEDAIATLERSIADFGAPRDDFDYARGVVRLSGLRAAAGATDPARILAPMQAGLKDGVVGPFLLNIVPNLAVAQIALGQPAAAIATIDRYPTDPAKLEARAAFGYFLAIRGCAEAKLAHAARARAIMTEVERDYAANIGAVDLAIGCMGSDAQVLARWIARVDDPDTRTGALMAMYGTRMGTEEDVLEVASRGLRAIANRPEVTRKLAQYGRQPAASYIPAMRGWRVAKP